MKLISFNFILFLSLHISNATAQVNTEWMRDENVEKIFTNKFKLDFGYETSKDEIFDILVTASSNFYIQNNLHAFLVMNYQNGFISNSDGRDIILNRGFGHLRFTKKIISYMCEVVLIGWARALSPYTLSDWEVQPFCLLLGNFRTLTNFKYPLLFSSKIAEPKEIKGKRWWIVLVKKEKEREKLLK